jgi:hypothetical protein
VKPRASRWERARAGGDGSAFAGRTIATVVLTISANVHNNHLVGLGSPHQR